MNRFIFALLLTGAACTHPSLETAATGTATTPDINPHDLRVRLTAFAHDSMMGREAGTIWDTRATDWVAEQFRRYGLQPAGENGGYFQEVPDIRARDTTARGPARNVVAIVRGNDPALANEYVAITAHNDHIGFTHQPVDHDSLRAANIVTRPLGADSPRRDATPEEMVRIRAMIDSLHKRHGGARLDSISNGADDDGSGTIALIELAEAFTKSGVKPRRSILFVSHTAEEKGLRGSAWYTDHSTVPMESIVAEIDLDMIGRGAAVDNPAGSATYLEVVGLRRLSKEYGDWFEAVNARQRTPFVFNYEYDVPGHPQQYYCRADHYSYARYGVPSVSLSRGAHMDYHQVTDEPQYIDYPDYARLTQLVFDAALFVANADHRPGLSVPKPTDPHVRCRQ